MVSAAITMKIKRIEITGFKSFVERTSLDFDDGITSIVGPNGCGKSNVVDAIRWVMGEQSARNLRGRLMEDVIFGGSENRKPLGMAEVNLIMDNTSGLAPAAFREYAEIQVTRRLYRNGESEYLLNRTPCRLLDITELFMDTGVGTRAYSIIEQGKIGMIINAKPEDRRSLIEEAAGVTKFKARKKTALRKIEATRQNLLRLSDIISEVRRQMNSLKRQAQRAKRFREFREELRGLELQFGLRQYSALQARAEQAGSSADQQTGRKTVGPLTRLLYHDRLPRRHQPAARHVAAEDAHAAWLLRLRARAAKLVLHQHQLVRRVRLARHAHEGEAPGQPAAARHDLHQRQRGVLLQREDRDRVMPAIRRVQKPSVCRDADLGGVRGPVVCDTASGGETSR